MVSTVDVAVVSSGGSVSVRVVCGGRFCEAKALLLLMFWLGAVVGEIVEKVRPSEVKCRSDTGVTLSVVSVGTRVLVFVEGLQSAS